MRKSRQLALVGAGQVRQSSIARLPNLVEQLGPVKAQSFRLASRIVNTLRAGYPVHHYEDLQESRLVLVCVPPTRLPRFLAEMADSGCDWRRKAVVVCDATPASANLDELTERGASLGSLCPLDGPGDRRFLIEGDRPAVRVVRRLLEAAGAKVLELRRYGQPLYSAGESFLSDLLVPLLDAADACFHEAGLTPRQAATLIERALERSLRAYLKGGRKAWKGALASHDNSAVLAQMEALRRADPALAAFCLESSVLVLRRFAKDARWLEELVAPRRAAAGSGG